jgi:hypothetical protein
MKSEILQAIKAAALIEEQKSKLVVGTGISRVPKDSEGNIFGSPIMVHFDAGKGLVFFRISDEQGDPWGFEVALPVAEALGLALNDLLGLFDSVEAEKIYSLEADLSATASAANYFAEEKEILEKKIEEQKSEIKDLRDALKMSERMIGEPGFKNFISKRLAELEHFAARVSGLWATDRPDLVDQSLLNDVVLFKIEPPEDPKSEEVTE